MVFRQVESCFGGGGDLEWRGVYPPLRITSNWQLEHCLHTSDGIFVKPETIGLKQLWEGSCRNLRRSGPNGAMGSPKTIFLAVQVDH